jgi:hypothetical protein
MAQETRDTLKTYFETGDFPDQTQFQALLDSIPVFKDAVYTNLSGNSWDGSFVSKILNANTVLSLFTSRRNGMMVVVQDTVGGRTLSINGTPININTAANAETIIQFTYVDSLGRFLFVPVREIAGVSVGGPDLTAPVISSMVVNNSAPGTILITYNEALTGVGSMTIGQFTASGSSSGSHGITFAQASGAEVLIATSLNFVAGETITLSYSGSQIKDTAGNLAAGFTGLHPTNNVGLITLNILTGLAQTSNTSTSITMGWTDTNSSPNDSGTEIWVATLADHSDAAFLANVAAGTTTYTHTGLTAGVTRYYQAKPKGNGTTTQDGPFTAWVTMNAASAGAMTVASAPWDMYRKVDNTFGTYTIQGTSGHVIKLKDRPNYTLANNVFDMSAANATSDEPVHVPNAINSQGAVRFVGGVNKLYNTTQTLRSYPLIRCGMVYLEALPTTNQYLFLNVGATVGLDLCVASAAASPHTGEAFVYAFGAAVWTGWFPAINTLYWIVIKKYADGSIDFQVNDVDKLTGVADSGNTQFGGEQLAGAADADWLYFEGGIFKTTIPTRTQLTEIYTDLKTRYTSLP